MCSSPLLPALKITRNSFERIQSHTDFFDSSGFITSYTLRLSLLPAINILFANQYSRLCRTIFRFSFTIRSGRRIYRHSYSRRTKRAAGYHFADMARITRFRKTGQSPSFPGYRSGPSGICQNSYLPMTGIPFYLKALQELKRTYINTPFVIEVMAKEANEYTTDLHASTYDRSVTPQQLVTKKKRLSHSAKKE